MPFNPFTRRSLTVASVSMNAPAAPGIYGVTNASGWIHIGQSGLSSSFVVLPGAQPRQDRLVFEYDPRFDRMPQNPERGQGPRI